jgi:hypothetical protein
LPRYVWEEFGILCSILKKVFTIKNASIFGDSPLSNKTANNKINYIEV